MMSQMPNHIREKGKPGEVLSCLDQSFSLLRKCPENVLTIDAQCLILRPDKVVS
jgi:hypothetical protein